MSNVMNNPAILDTAAATVLGFDVPIRVKRIVWEGTTIVTGDQVKIVSGSDGTSILWEATASSVDASATNQRIDVSFNSPLIWPSKNAGGFALTVLTHGKIFVYFD